MLITLKTLEAAIKENGYDVRINTEVFRIELYSIPKESTDIALELLSTDSIESVLSYIANGNFNKDLEAIIPKDEHWDNPVGWDDLE